MKVFIKVKPRAKIEEVKKIDEEHFKIFLKEAPEKGKANKRLIKILAEYFKVPKSSVQIVKGKLSRNKIVEIRAEETKQKVK